MQEARDNKEVEQKDGLVSDLSSYLSHVAEVCSCPLLLFSLLWTTLMAAAGGFDREYLRAYAWFSGTPPHQESMTN